jgi:hypothetical protein
MILLLIHSQLLHSQHQTTQSTNGVTLSHGQLILIFSSHQTLMMLPSTIIYSPYHQYKIQLLVKKDRKTIPVMITHIKIIPQALLVTTVCGLLMNITQRNSNFQFGMKQ